MASSKDTFESKTFAANSFACGALRGLGVASSLARPGGVFARTQTGRGFERDQPGRGIARTQTARGFRRVKP